jgi:hypothetical protein
LQLVFDGLGRVIHASADGASSADLERCIVVAARSWSLPGWEGESRLCDARICTLGRCRSECDRPVHPIASHRLIVTYPILLRPSQNADERNQLHLEASACWDRALVLGAAGEVAAHVTRHAEADGFEVVSVEETTLPPTAAICLAQVASRHLGSDADQWFWFHASGD